MEYIGRAGDSATGQFDPYLPTLTPSIQPRCRGEGEPIYEEFQGFEFLNEVVKHEDVEDPSQDSLIGISHQPMMMMSVR